MKASLTEGHRENTSVSVGHETRLATRGYVAYLAWIGQVRFLSGQINAVHVLCRKETDQCCICWENLMFLSFKFL